jgi:hypothetical protein
MGTIVPFIRETGVFEPKDIQAMSLALDEVCKALDFTDGKKAERECRRNRSPTL